MEKFRIEDTLSYRIAQQERMLALFAEFNDPRDEDNILYHQRKLNELKAERTKQKNNGES